MPNISKKEYIIFTTSSLLSTLCILGWFAPIKYHVYMGDDLLWMQIYQTGQLPSGFWASVIAMGTNVGKFRPITNALILLTTQLCQANFDCVVWVNYIVFLLNAFLMSVSAYFLTNQWLPSIFIAPIVFIFARFSYYSVLQLMGLMENISMTFVLAIVFCIIQIARTSVVKWKYLGIFFFMLLLGSHERFIVLIVPLLLLFLLEKKKVYKFEYLFPMFSLVLLTIFYILVKQYVFHADFFTGTGSTSVRDTFNISTFLSFVLQGIENMVGFNAGWDSLSGKHFLSAGSGGVLVGISLSGSLLILVFYYCYQKLCLRQGFEFTLVSTMLLMIGAMIAAGSITFRQEYRWLYAPFAVMILLLCFMLSEIISKKVRFIFTILLSISLLAVDIFYRPFIETNVFFMHGLRTASAVKAIIIDGLTDDVTQNDVMVIPAGNYYIEHWYLANGYFFKLYGLNPRFRIHFEDNINNISKLTYPDGVPLAFYVEGYSVKKVPEESMLKQYDENNAFLADFTTIYDFINAFADVVRDTKQPVTPIGRNAFIMYWPDNRGLIDQTMTLVSPSVIRYKSVNCQKGSEIIFRAGMPYNTGDGANLYIYIKSEGSNAQKIFDVPLKPAREDTFINWSAYNVPISSCTGGPVNIVFRVESPSGDQASDWVALTNVKLVVRK